MTVCLHCSSPCRLVTTAQVYGTDVFGDKPMWSCLKCSDSFVGCHPGTKDALGFAADSETRRARGLLHSAQIDRIWRGAPKRDQRETRTMVYWYLSHAMELPADETHVAMFSLEQCRQAWRVLAKEDWKSIMIYGENV